MCDVELWVVLSQGVVEALDAAGGAEENGNEVVPVVFPEFVAPSSEFVPGITCRGRRRRIPIASGGTRRCRPRERMFTTSTWVLAVAVAVRATQGALLRMFLTSRNFRKAGRKEWPHCEQQWHSSTANKGIKRRRLRQVRMFATLEVTRASGDANRILNGGGGGGWERVCVESACGAVGSFVRRERTIAEVASR